MKKYRLEDVLPAWLIRLQIEKSSLQEKVNSLETYMVTNDYFDLTKIEQMLLSHQSGEMKAYLNTLEMRLELYEA